MYKSGITESAIRESVWGNQDTGMAKIYVKLLPKDIDAAMLKSTGNKNGRRRNRK